MSDQTVIAESSAADVFNGETPSLSEYNQYRQTGELPERFKPAEPAESAPAADTPQESSEVAQTETASDSEPEQQQEKGKKRPQTASERIAHLKGTIEQLWQQDEPDAIKIAQLEATIEKIEQRSGQKRKTEPAPVTQAQQQEAPQTYADWEKAFEPEKWIEEYAKANPSASYEKANAAMFSHMLNVRDQFRTVEQQREAQSSALNAKVADARTRYGDNFDEILVPTLNTILQDQGVKLVVKEMVNDSEVVADLIYTLGSDPKELQEFLRMPTGQQLRYIAAVEAGIIEERDTEKTETPRDASGKFAAKEAPAKPKTQAPKPPSPVTGVASGAFDVSDMSLSPEEWARKRSEQLSKRG